MALAAAKRRVICVGYVVLNAATASYATTAKGYTIRLSLANAWLPHKPMPRSNE